MKKYLPYFIIIIIILVALLIYLNLSKNRSSLLSSLSNSNPEVSQNIGNNGELPFKNLGPAPEFAGIEKWLNVDSPIKMSELKGKVVLIDFWTYSCINCIRTLPYVKKWYDTYKGAGFVVIGVHTPEFAFEKDTGNVETALKRYGITYPVAQDNRYITWNAYNNQFWPAHYLIDKEGKIVYTHFGEGNYDVTENAIRQLIGLPSGVDAGEGPNPNANKIKSPEMYFGLKRLEFMSNAEEPSEKDQIYTLPKNLKSNTFALEGTWKLTPESAVMTQGYGRIKLNFNAGKVHMVAASIKPVTLKIKVDGKEQPEVTVQKSDLYTLFDSNDYKNHTLEIEITQPGLEAFTFTFG